LIHIYLERVLYVFIRQTHLQGKEDDGELGTNFHELAAKEVLATATRTEDMAEGDDDIAMPQAIETLVSRSGGHRKASPKLVQNNAIVREA
jgi:hypothetical protein